MTVYIDLEIILNFCYDLLLLITVDITLKRYQKFYRLFLAALFGSLAIFLLFLPFNKYILFLFKIITSIIMILIAYGFKDILYTFNNIFYLYMCSVILGGFLYYLNIEFKNSSFILLIIIAPVILYLYIKQYKYINKIIKCKYNVNIVFKNNYEINCIGYLDTANKLKDPITNKYVILVNKDLIKFRIRSPIYVPYKGLNKKGLILCYPTKYVKVDNKIYNNYLVGISNEKFFIDGVSCLLNAKLMEEI